MPVKKLHYKRLNEWYGGYAFSDNDYSSYNKIFKKGGGGPLSSIPFSKYEILSIDRKLEQKNNTNSSDTNVCIGSKITGYDRDLKKQVKGQVRSIKKNSYGKILYYIIVNEFNKQSIIEPNDIVKES